MIVFAVDLADLDIQAAPSKNFTKRYVPFLIQHYTACDLQKTLATFQKQDVVSAHFTVSEEGAIYKHVETDHVAYHAGLSYFANLFDLNLHSIGIEHVNYGYSREKKPWNGTELRTLNDFSYKLLNQWAVYKDPQIDASIKLSLKITDHYRILPFCVLGHSDIAPGRKQDPGPLFPWKQFAEYGVGLWPTGIRSGQEPSDFKEQYSDELFEEKLLHYGYMDEIIAPIAFNLKEVDREATKKDIIASFQMHFRPEKVSGSGDQECLNIINDLISQRDAILEGNFETSGLAGQRLKVWSADKKHSIGIAGVLQRFKRNLITSTF